MDFKLFDDPALDAHLKHLTKPPRRKSRKKAEVIPMKQIGVVSRVNSKGYLFLKPIDGGDDVFCHFSTLVKCGIHADKIEPGDRLAFSLGKSTHKPGREEAIDVVFANDAP
jgi:cold shock CspA family protein